ncbi:MAG: GGDEF domain-containing protein [Burkholderiales bacterium]
MTLVALVVASVVGVSLPGLYLYQSVSSEISASEATVRAYAMAINRVISRHPDTWRYQEQLLQEVVELGTYRSGSGARSEAMRILGAKGEEIFSTAGLPPEPRVVRRAEISASGNVAGAAEYSVSLRGLLPQVLAVCLLGLALGGMIFGVLRSLPLRAVNRAFSALQQEVTRAEAALVEKEAAEQTLRDSEARLRRRAESDQLLEALVVVANMARDPAEAITLFLDRLCDFAGWPLGHGCLIEVSGDFAVASRDHWHGVSSGNYNEIIKAANGYRYPLKDGNFVTQMIRTAAPVWVEDVLLAGRFRALRESLGGEQMSGMCFPITRRREVIGFFEFFAPMAAKPDAVLSDLILRAGAHVGLVAERVAASGEIVKLNEDLERRVVERGAQMERANALLMVRNRETSLLAEMTSVLQIAADLNEASMLVSRYLPAVLPGTEGGAMYLMRASRDNLERLSTWGHADGVKSFPPAQCWGMRRGHAHGSRIGAVPLTCAHLESDAHTGGSLCLPLVAQGESLGLLNVSYIESGDEVLWSDRNAAAKRVAEQLSLALANVRLRESLREQSIRDTLTGLHNRRYLEESLNRELSRCLRDGQQLALFMLDVDHFKRYNDTHGHEAGDIVLRELGRALRESARASDIVCRYGGEEFTVVLPNTSEQEASAWSERLMRRIRAMEVQQGSRSLPAVTISMGLAIFPQHGAGADALLQSADLALYEAKRAGRDRLKIVDITTAKSAPELEHAA